MTTHLIKLSSRLALFICGTITILLGRTFNVTQVAMPVASVDWFLLSIPLVLVGGLTVLIALLPSSWVEPALNSSHGAQNRPSMPIKLLGGFAVFSYLLTVALNYIPPGWHLTAQTVYLVCPACVLTVTVDPSLGTVMLLLAPMNAAVYGSLGVLLGHLFLAVRNRI
jgi:cellobiose-specific phosphotransferase system component IIC